MTADTITINRLKDLLAALDAAQGSVLRAWLASRGGAISPAEAAAIVNETVTYLNKTAE